MALHVISYSPTLYVVYKETAVAMMDVTSYHFHLYWKTSQAQSMFPLENKPFSPASK